MKNEKEIYEFDFTVMFFMKSRLYETINRKFKEGFQITGLRTSRKAWFIIQITTYHLQFTKITL